MYTEDLLHYVMTIQPEKCLKTLYWMSFHDFRFQSFAAENTSNRAVHNFAIWRDVHFLAPPLFFRNTSLCLNLFSWHVPVGVLQEINTALSSPVFKLNFSIPKNLASYNFGAPTRAKHSDRLMHSTVSEQQPCNRHFALVQLIIPYKYTGTSAGYFDCLITRGLGTRVFYSQLLS